MISNQFVTNIEGNPFEEKSLVTHLITHKKPLTIRMFLLSKQNLNWGMVDPGKGRISFGSRFDNSNTCSSVGEAVLSR